MTAMPASIVELTDRNFDREVLKSDKPVLVDFWATWCGPCQAISGSIKVMADEFKDRVKIAKLDVDAFSELATKYKVVSIPTLIIFTNGTPQQRLTGAAPRAKIRAFLQQAMDGDAT